MTFKSTFSPSNHTAFGLDSDEQPSGSHVVAIYLASLGICEERKYSLVDLLDQMGILTTLRGEASMWLGGIVSLDTLGVFRSELVWWKVGSLFLGDLGGDSGLTEGSRGVGVRLGHVECEVSRGTGRCVYELIGLVKRSTSGI